MAKWTAAKRRAYKASHPDNWGDPQRGLYPIEDQDDVDSAAHLIGKAQDPAAVKRRIIAIAKRLKLTIPKAWQADASAVAQGGPSMTAEFKAISRDGQTVIRRGKLWQAGEYPDKDFVMSAEENAAAVDSFSAPLPLDLEHTPTVLDGKIGQLQDVELSADGEEIFGTVAIPRWLDDVLGEAPVKVSCTWDRDSKTLRKLALVRDPRVSDAAVMSAYAAFAGAGAAGGTGDLVTFDPADGDGPGKRGARRHDTPTGQALMQEIHDMAARGGAVCARSNVVGMQSRHELMGIQAIHDAAMEHGAYCPALGVRQVRYSSGRSAAGGRAMDIWARIRRLTGGGQAAAEQTSQATDQATAQTSQAAPAGAVQFDLDVPDRSADPQVAALQAELAQMRQESIEKDAVEYARGLVRMGKALPAEVESLAVLYVQAAMDDHRDPRQVTFGQGQQGSRLDALKAAHALRPANRLTGELLQTGELLFNQALTPGLNPSADSKAASAAADNAAREWAQSMNGKKA